MFGHWILDNCEEKLFWTIEQLNIVNCKSRPIIGNNWRQQKLLATIEKLNNWNNCKGLMVGHRFFVLQLTGLFPVDVTKTTEKQLNISRIATIPTIAKFIWLILVEHLVGI